MGDRWGPEGPPDEAYSRVTNPERFAPLVPFAELLIVRLERDFLVSREESYDLPITHWSPPRDLTRASVRLMPSDDSAAQITIAFSGFPGIMILAGHWQETSFPSCGCDACDETAQGGQSELESMVMDVVSGRMIEFIEPADHGDSWLGSIRWGPEGRSSGRIRIDQDKTPELLATAGGRTRFEYSAWPRRESAS